MRRFKGLGGRRSSFEVPKPPDEIAGTPTPMPKAKRSSVHGAWRDFAPAVFVSQRRSFTSSGAGDRRRSVDEQQRRASSAGVRGESEGKLIAEYQQQQQMLGVVGRGVMTSGRTSYSSCSEFPSSASSSRPSDASSLQMRSERRMGHVRAIVVAFDANSRDALVGAISWAFLTVLRPGDELVLVGVLQFIRGPLGYKCQVTDQTSWLGSNRKHLHDAVTAKRSAWLSSPVLQPMCEEHGVKLIVEVKPSQRPEVAVVQEAIAFNAVHVILDKSLSNVTRGRKYYLDRLSCDVTRMRRSGGVEILRAKEASSLVLPASGFLTRPPPPGLVPSTASFLHRDDEEELFTIDHCRFGPRVSVDEGYESDDLFSICGDGGTWRTSSGADQTPSAAAARLSVESSRLDNRLLSLTPLEIGD